MQFPTWSVDKLRKPLLVMVIVLASFLLGGTIHQAHAATKDTQFSEININDAISIIDMQRTQTAQSLWTLDGFSPNYNYYYRQAADDYDNFIKPSVNRWLGQLVNEAQHGDSLNSDINNDPSTIKGAMRESHKLNDWVTSISSGSDPIDLADFSEADSNDWQDALQKLGDGFGYYVSDCIQQIEMTEQWWPSWEMQSSSPQQCQPESPSSQTSQSSDDTSQPSDTPKTCFLWLWC